MIDEVALPLPEEIRPDERKVMLYEFKAGLNAYLGGLGPAAPVKSLAEVIAFNRQNRDRVMPFFPQDLLEAAKAKGPLDEPAYREALATTKRRTRETGIDAAIGHHRLDAIVAPTTCTPWLIDWVNGDNRSGGSAAPPPPPATPTNGPGGLRSRPAGGSLVLCRGRLRAGPHPLRPRLRMRNKDPAATGVPRHREFRRYA